MSGDDGGGGTDDPSELASSYIVSVDASLSLVRSEENWKYGRIPTIVDRAQHHFG